MQSTERDIAIIDALAQNFYNVIPHRYTTYCSFTSRISQVVLTHFGIKCELLPCQVWLVMPDVNYIVGFVGNKMMPGRWDGHVVCKAGNVIIDAALKNFERDFGLNVPFVALATCFDVPTQVIARRDISPQTRLWWHYPPSSTEINLDPPEEPYEQITRAAADLIAHLSTTTSAGMAAAQDNMHSGDIRN